MEHAEGRPIRVAIFIDGSNFYHSMKSTFMVSDSDSNVDFRKLIDILKGGRLLVGTYYYNASLDRGFNAEIYWKQQKFFADLRTIPDFHVVLCRLRKGGDGVYTVKGDDINIATDMVSMAYENQYDVAILVSGDGDFVPAIKKVQKLNKNVENACFHCSASNFLKSVCGSSIPLDEIIEQCFKK